MSTSIPPVPENIYQAGNVAPVDMTQGSALSTDTTKVQISSMEDLRTKAPAVYDSMTMGIALRIRSEQEHYAQRMRELQRKQREG